MRQRDFSYKRSMPGDMDGIANNAKFDHKGVDLNRLGQDGRLGGDFFGQSGGNISNINPRQSDNKRISIFDNPRNQGQDPSHPGSHADLNINNLNENNRNLVSGMRQNYDHNPNPGYKHAGSNQLPPKNPEDNKFDLQKKLGFNNHSTENTGLGMGNKLADLGSQMNYLGNNFIINQDINFSQKQGSPGMMGSQHSMGQSTSISSHTGNSHMGSSNTDFQLNQNGLKNQ